MSSSIYISQHIFYLFSLFRSLPHSVAIYSVLNIAVGPGEYNDAQGGHGPCLHGAYCLF